MLHAKRAPDAFIPSAVDSPSRGTGTAGQRTTLPLPTSAHHTRLKLLTIFAPMVFLTAVDFVRQVLYPSILNLWPGYLLVYGVVLVGMVLFSETVFRLVDKMQSRLVLQNRELLALHEAGLDVAGELDLEVVLQKIVERARELVGARFGALSLLGEGGDIEASLTSIDPDSPPADAGVPLNALGSLHSVLVNGHPTRLGSHSSPLGQSLVAVPILSHGRGIGMIQLAGKIASGEFGDDDEGTLVRFATQAALAIQNARLHRQVRALAITAEREWIAREMHDSLAQVLGYVNIKAQAAQELLRTGQVDRARIQIGQLVEAARAAYADVREGILGLRASRASGGTFEEALRDYLDRWQEQCGVVGELVTSTEAEPTLPLSSLAEVQILRIVQEALSNVRKHAQASEATVSLNYSCRLVEVVVEDNGVGFDPGSLGHAGVPRFGLSTMRERAEAIGGTFEVRSAIGHGTRIRVRVPIDDAGRTTLE